jgi:alkaline phosphatase
MSYVFSLILICLSTQSIHGFQQLDIDSLAVKNSVQRPLERLPLVEDRPIKNVILIIGDGIGMAQLASAQINFAGPDGELQSQRMPVTGFFNTHSANRLITDSAAAGTALSCGIKTNNGMLAQLPDNRNCKTILELAEEKGKSTGLVATSTITHATPASYASHIDSRNKQDEIAVQYLKSGVEVFLGGGIEYFVPQSDTSSARTDDRNLILEFESIGYEVVNSKEELNTSNSERLLGLFSDSGMPSENRTPTLREMSEKAIEVLNTNENGFFLMIESSQIDWAGHANDLEYILREFKDLESAVESVLDFAVQDGETLVVLTSDHETGGMNIISGDTQDKLAIAWATGNHSGVPVPLLAYGPHAIQLTGWWDNTEIAIKLAEMAGLGVLPQIIE